MRRILSTALCSLAFLFFFVADGRAALRPNFVVLQTDDQSSRMLWERFRDQRGRLQPAMPFLRSIMPRGAYLANHYAASPLCAPSRAAFLSGQHPHNNDVLYNGTDGGEKTGGWSGWQGSEAYSDNFVSRLQFSGYHTAHLGKFFNHYEAYGEEDIPPGWSTWLTDADDESTRNYYGYSQIERPPGGAATIRGPIGSPFYSLREDIDRIQCSLAVGRGCNYHTDRMGRLALRQISSTRQPFYLQIDFHAPHGDRARPSGAQPATRHLDLAGRAPLPRGGNWNEKSVLDKPRQLRRASLRRWERDRIRSFYRRGMESLRSVDEVLRAIYRSLQRQGQLGNTYIVFLSDNGIFLGNHRFVLGKGLSYDEVSRTPAWIMGPNVSPGRSGAAVSGVDWAPTFADLAGISKAGLRFDGRSILASLGDVSPWRPQLISAPNPEDLRGEEFPLGEAATLNSGTGTRFRALKIGPYKLTRHWLGGAELYDLRFDPAEQYNQIGNPGYRELALWMASRLEEMRSCREDACNLSPQPPAPTGWTEEVDSGIYPALLP